MLRTNPKQLSMYSILYNNIPENHMLKTINQAIDLTFVNEQLEGSYCKYYGRPAKEPELMLRIQILKHLYNLSDEHLIQDLSVNLAYKWFVGLNPEDPLPETSLLTKFRTQRLNEICMDDIMTEIVRQCIKKGLVEETNGSIVDTTHSDANTVKKVPERIMKQLARKIFKAKGQEDYELPDYTKIEDPKEAKQVMKDYLEDLMEQVGGEDASEEVGQAVSEAREVLDSDLFLSQKGIRSLVDKDARVGYKSKTKSFYGYKIELCQTTGEGLITSVIVEPGNYVDGTRFKEHLERARQAGLLVSGVYGDKAYFRPDILHLIQEHGAAAYIPVSASTYKIDETLFGYNKDSDQWVCVMGNETGSANTKTRERQGKKEKLLEYSFEREGCRHCPLRDECLGKSKRVARKLRISINTPELYAYSQRAKTPAFLEEYRKRAKIEPKNAELKRFHGLDRAKGHGLRSIRVQAKLTAIAVNLKRIAKLVSALKSLDPDFLRRFYDLLFVSQLSRLRARLQM